MTKTHSNSNNIEITKNIHRVWLEWQEFVVKKVGHPFRDREPIIGKYQYIVTNRENHNAISVVELPNYLMDGITLWEIYCLEGNLFEDIERFRTLEEAIEKSKKYLLKNK